MTKTSQNTAIHIAAASTAIAVLTYACLHLLKVNATTTALIFLLAILVVSTVWELSTAVVMSVLAVLAFNFFFLQPVRTFTVSDPQNWVALLVFLIVAVVSSRLSARARRQAEEALARRREIERLYRFSQRMMVTGNVIELLNRIPLQIVEVFEVGAAALYLASKHKVYHSGAGIPQLSVEHLQAIVAREEPIIDWAGSLCFVPVRMGLRPVGSLGISGAVLSRQTLEALGTLVATAMERARAVEELGQNEASRESEKLRTALLDSITHEFRTPLTSIKASVTSLLSNSSINTDQRHELLTVINEESDRLNRLVGEAAEMSRLDAGEVELRLEPVPADAVIRAAIEHCRSSLAKRQVVVHVAPHLPPVRADLKRTREVLVHLIENANLYSPPEQPITVTAELSEDAVQMSVADRGNGIDAQEQGLIFDKFYRGKDQRYRVHGTGMGLPIARALVTAQGGTIGVTSQLGHGSVFTFSLPVDR